jgi:hypothetical protein
VGLTAAAALAGVLTWYFSSRLSNAKDAAFDRFKEESKVAVAEATARAAEANRIAEEEKLARVSSKQDWRQDHLVPSRARLYLLN